MLKFFRKILGKQQVNDLSARNVLVEARIALRQWIDE